MAFKMKGNPYKMGAMATKSALKQVKKPYSGTTDSPTRQFEPGDYYDTKTDERKLPMDMKSPAKAHKKGHDDLISPTNPNTKEDNAAPLKDTKAGKEGFEHGKEVAHDKDGKHKKRYGAPTKMKSPVKDYSQNQFHSQGDSRMPSAHPHKKREKGRGGLVEDGAVPINRKKAVDKLPVVKNGGKVAKP